MTKRRWHFFIAALVTLLFCFCSVLHADAVDEEHAHTGRMDARGIIEEFMGAPYERAPLGEGDNEAIYREDAFDCTTLVLTVAAKLNAGRQNATEMMKQVHYYPPGKVSFGTRLHFSSYRNRVSDYFQDITSRIGGGITKSEAVVLNRRRPGEGRLIDIDWQKRVRVEYVPSSNVPDLVEKLPDVVGVGFVRTESFEKGLAITHEGILLDGRTLVHASLKEGKVVRMDFLDYLSRQEYSGVSFFSFRQVAERNQTLRKKNTES